MEEGLERATLVEIDARFAFVTITALLAWLIALPELAPPPPPPALVEASERVLNVPPLGVSGRGRGRFR